MTLPKTFLTFVIATLATGNGAIAGPRSVTDGLKLLNKAGEMVERADGAKAAIDATVNGATGALSTARVAAAGAQASGADMKDASTRSLNFAYDVGDAAHAVTGKSDPLGAPVGETRKYVVDGFSQALYTRQSKQHDAMIMTDHDAPQALKDEVIRDDGKLAAENRAWADNSYASREEDGGPSWFDMAKGAAQKSWDYTKTAAEGVAWVAKAAVQRAEQTRCGSEGCDSFSDFFSAGRGGEIVFPKSESDVATNEPTRYRSVDPIPQPAADVQRAARDQLTNRDYQRQESNRIANAQAQAMIGNILGTALGAALSGGFSRGGGGGNSGNGGAVCSHSPGSTPSKACWDWIDQTARSQPDMGPMLGRVVGN